jgi:hypothetical protein
LCTAPAHLSGGILQLESSPIQYAPVVTSGQREPRSTSVHSTPSANDKKITPTVVLPIIPPRTRQRSTDSATSAGKMKQGRISSGSKPRHVSAHTSVDSDGGSESIKSVSKLRVVHGDEVLADTVHDAFEVIVFGSINMDMIAATSTYPRNGTTMAASHFQTKPGGKGANEAVAVARLGVPTVLVGRIGKDLFGDQLLKSLVSHHIHIALFEGPRAVFSFAWHSPRRRSTARGKFISLADPPPSSSSSEIRKRALHWHLCCRRIARRQYRVHRNLHDHNRRG